MELLMVLYPEPPDWFTRNVWNTFPHSYSAPPNEIIGTIEWGALNIGGWEITFNPRVFPLSRTFHSHHGYFEIDLDLRVQQFRNETPTCFVQPKRMVPSFLCCFRKPMKFHEQFHRCIQTVRHDNPISVWSKSKMNPYGEIALFCWWSLKSQEISIVHI